MNNNPLRLRNFFLSTLALLWTCGSQADVTGDMPEVTIVATGNLNGELEPCG